MRILVGSLGRLGFLVKDVTRVGASREWAIYRDEASLSGRLSSVFPEIEIRGALRRVRREGRVVLSCDDREGSRLVGRIPSAV